MVTKSGTRGIKRSDVDRVLAEIRSDRMNAQRIAGYMAGESKTAARHRQNAAIVE